MRTKRLFLAGIVALVALACVGVVSACEDNCGDPCGNPCGDCCPPPPDLGCTPGYWKNHPDAWIATLPTGDIGGIGDLNGDGKEDTFMDALNYKGGSGDTGALRILLRAGIAQRLNIFAFGSGYPATTEDVEYFKYLKSHPDGNRNEMLALAGIFDEWNNGYCPCNKDGCPDLR